MSEEAGQPGGVGVAAEDAAAGLAAAAPTAGPESRSRWLEAAKRWLSQGNVPVKVGMVVLFAGVAAFLKYASDEGWLRAPIEVRFGSVALAAVGALVFGLRERRRRPAFSLALQGGAIGILHLTVFVAFRFYDLLPQGLAFAILICLVAGTGILAIVQNARSLAILAALAGFLAPILVSRGGGNHVVLFSWYAVLDLFVIVVAWWRRWRLLGTLAFVLTSGFVGAWAATRYQPEHVWSVQLFATFFFLVFALLPVLQIRRAGETDAPPHHWLVFGNPLFYFGMQARMLHDQPLVLGFVVLGVAALYLALAWLLRRREEARTLRDSFAALSIAAATLAVPMITASTQITTGAFALEGAALVWLALRQGRRFPLWSGLVLEALAALVFLDELASETTPFINASFVAGLWVFAAGAFSAWHVLRRGRRKLAGGVATATLLVWSLACVHEVRNLSWNFRDEGLLVWAVATAWLLAEANRKLEERYLGWAASLWMLLAVFAAIVQAQYEPFVGWLWGEWEVVLLLGGRAIACMRRASTSALAVLHLGFQLAVAIGLMGVGVELAQIFDLGAGWRTAAGALPLLILHAATLRRARWTGEPAGERFPSYRRWALVVQAVALALWFSFHLGRPGSATPLPYVPLLNPTDLAVVAWLLLAARWLRDEDAPSPVARLGLPLFAALGFVAITSATFRAVHWIGSLPWGWELATRMELRASLSVVWSVMGMATWVAGSRRGSRPLWLVGAVLLSLVLVKLALVDRAHLGNLPGIVSFLAFGLLCTLVGYLAPAPPRDETRLS